MTIQCLGVHVPRCIDELRREPPVCWATNEDVEALNLLKAFAQRFNRPENETKHACNLAYGLSDIVVILERPRKGQVYSVDFETFVRDCRSLAYVDELIRFGSKGTRSIHTVTVLDAFSFQPVPEGRPDFGSNGVPSRDCHELVEEILKLKRPQVVVCCWSTSTGSCDNAVVSQFKSHGVGSTPLWDDIQRDATFWNQTRAIRSFHPGSLLYESDFKLATRFLLLSHFALAFASLAGPTQVPQWLNCLNDTSATEMKNSRSATFERGYPLREPYMFLDDYARASCIHSTLKRALGDKRNFRWVARTEKGLENQKSTIQRDMESLFASSPTNQARNIAKLQVLWRDYHCTDQQRTLDRLDEIAATQIDLFPASRTEPTITQVSSVSTGSGDKSDDANHEQSTPETRKAKGRLEGGNVDATTETTLQKGLDSLSIQD